MAYLLLYIVRELAECTIKTGRNEDGIVTEPVDPARLAGDLAFADPASGRPYLARGIADSHDADETCRAVFAPEVIDLP